MANIYPNPYRAYPVWKHEAEHAPGGSDELKGLDISQFKPASFIADINYPFPDSIQTVAVDSTGVKWTSKFSALIFNKDLVKSAALIVNSINTAVTDATIVVEAIDASSGTVLGSVTYSGGVVGILSGTIDLANLTSGYLTVQVNVTTASATVGATCDVAGIGILLQYGFA